MTGESNKNRITERNKTPPNCVLLQASGMVTTGFPKLSGKAESLQQFLGETSPSCIFSDQRKYIQFLQPIRHIQVLFYVSLFMLYYVSIHYTDC